MLEHVYEQGPGVGTANGLSYHAEHSFRKCRMRTFCQMKCQHKNRPPKEAAFSERSGKNDYVPRHKTSVRPRAYLTPWKGTQFLIWISAYLVHRVPSARERCLIPKIQPIGACSLLSPSSSLSRHVGYYTVEQLVRARSLQLYDDYFDSKLPSAD